MVSNQKCIGHALRRVVGIAIFFLLLVAGANAATITVPDDYAKIQWAIDNATTGDTILVHSGIYYENLNVTKQLILKGVDTGEGKPTVNAVENKNAITLSADKITLEGFNVVGNYPTTRIAVNSNDNIINNNIVSNLDDGYGIYLYYSNNNMLDSNSASLSYYGGINLYYSNNNTLKGNSAHENSGGTGIVLQHSNNNELNGNIAYFNHGGEGIGEGILLKDSYNNTLDGNTASSNGQGIILENSGNNTLTNNIMYDNHLNFVSFNIDNQIDTSNLVDGKSIYYLKNIKDMIYDSSTNAGTFYCISCINVTVKDQTLTNNGVGVFFYNTTNSRIQNVTAMMSMHGLYLGHSNNNIVINTKAIEDTAFNIFLSDSNNNILDGNDVPLGYSWIDDLMSGGIILVSSNNNTLKNNIFDSYPEAYLSISLKSSSKNNIYNNYFNDAFIDADAGCSNSWNTTKIEGKNIVDEVYLGGNFWGSKSGTGFSQTCSDEDRDGICDSPYVLDSNNIDYLPLSIYKPVITATVDIDPDNLNKDKKNDKKEASVYIEIHGYDVNDIDVSTIKLSTQKGYVMAELSPTEVGDYDYDNIPDRMVKFNMQDVLEIVDIGDQVKLTISGMVSGNKFEGFDQIRVKGKEEPPQPPLPPPPVPELPTIVLMGLGLVCLFVLSRRKH
jgi:parallel beta-helix repeat protein